jgi:hypothetical protein
VYVCVYVCVCVCVCVHVKGSLPFVRELALRYLNVDVNVREGACHSYVYMYIYIYIYTHTHAYKK